MQSKSAWAYAEQPSREASWHDGQGDDSNSGRHDRRPAATGNHEPGSAAAPSSASSDSAADASPGRHGSPTPQQRTDGVSNGLDVDSAAAQSRRSVDAQSMGPARSGRLQSQSSLSAALALAAQQTASLPRTAAQPIAAKPAWKRTDVRLSAATFQWSRPSGTSSPENGQPGTSLFPSPEQAAWCSANSVRICSASSTQQTVQRADFVRC